LDKRESGRMRLREKGQKPWSVMSAMGTMEAGLSLGILAWAANFRLDRWSAQPFVLLLYAALTGALVGTLAIGRARREDSKAWDGLGALRRLTWFALAVCFSWIWLPQSEHVVGWWIRQVSMFRFR